MQHVFLNAFSLNPVFNGKEPVIDYFLKDIIPHLRRPDENIVR